MRLTTASLIRNMRIARGLRQEELAEMAGVSRPNLSNIERGRTDPRASTLERIADALGLALLAPSELDTLAGVVARAQRGAARLNALGISSPSPRARLAARAARGVDVTEELSRLDELTE